MKINGISATIEYPENGLNKLAVLMPGYLDSKDYSHLKLLAKDLNRNGYQTIRFNPTGTWDSDGVIEEYTLTRYLKDTETVINYVIELNKKNYDEIILLGHSFGGRAALVYASRHPEIDTVVTIMTTLDSAKNPRTSALLPNWEKSGVRVSKRNLPNDPKEFVEFVVPYSFEKNRANYDPAEFIQNYKNRLLVIAAENDDVAPPDNVKDIFEMANEPKEYKLIKGIGHDYRHDPNQIELVNKEIVRFLHEKDKIEIVDENDNPIGAKERFKVTHEDIYRVTGLWVTNPAGEILLAQRSFNKSHSPGCWATAVSGTVEAGESYEENVYKEAREELGITGEKFEKGPHTRSEGPWQHFTQWFFYKTDKKAENFQINKNELEQVKWFKPEEILKQCEEKPESFLKSLPKRVKQFSDL